MYNGYIQITELKVSIHVHPRFGSRISTFTGLNSLIMTYSTDNYPDHHQTYPRYVREALLERRRWIMSGFIEYCFWRIATRFKSAKEEINDTLPVPMLIMCNIYAYDGFSIQQIWSMLLFDIWQDSAHAWAQMLHHKCLWSNRNTIFTESVHLLDVRLLSSEFGPMSMNLKLRITMIIM